MISNATKDPQEEPDKNTIGKIMHGAQKFINSYDPLKKANYNSIKFLRGEQLRISELKSEPDAPVEFLKKQLESNQAELARLVAEEARLDGVENRLENVFFEIIESAIADLNKNPPANQGAGNIQDAAAQRQVLQNEIRRLEGQVRDLQQQVGRIEQ